MNPGSLCITASDPTFIGAMAAGVIGAAALSALMVWLERRFFPGGWPASQRNLVWFLGLVAVVAGPLTVLNVLFSWRYPGATLCTANVGYWFLGPPIVLFVGGAFWSTWITGSGGRPDATQAPPA